MSDSSPQDQLDAFCLRYVIFVGAVCLLAFGTLGWPVIMTWLLVAGGMRIFQQAMSE